MEKKAIKSKTSKVDTGLTSKAGDPTRDKDFQTVCAKKIIGFLVRHIFDSPISLQTLLTPDIRLFWQIFDFTIKQVDPTAKCTNENELTALLKWLDYPFTITPKMLLGSPHSWGNLLALLNWVIEVLLPMPQLQNDEAKLLHMYFLETYTNQDTRVQLREQLFEKYETIVLEYQERTIEIEEGIEGLLEDKPKKDFAKELLEFHIQEVQIIEEISNLEAEVEELQQTKNKLHRSDTDAVTHIKKCIEFVEEEVLAPIQDRMHMIQTSMKNAESECSALEESIQATVSTLNALEESERTANQEAANAELATLLDTEVSLQTQLNTNAQALRSIEESLSALRQQVKDKERAMFNDILKTRRTMTEDTQHISIHAQKIADWLDELTVQPPGDLFVV